MASNASKRGEKSFSGLTAHFRLALCEYDSYLSNLLANASKADGEAEYLAATS